MLLALFGNNMISLCTRNVIWAYRKTTANAHVQPSWSITVVFLDFMILCSKPCAISLQPAQKECAGSSGVAYRIFNVLMPSNRC